MMGSKSVKLFRILASRLAIIGVLMILVGCATT